MCIKCVAQAFEHTEGAASSSMLHHPGQFWIGELYQRSAHGYVESGPMRQMSWLYKSYPYWFIEKGNRSVRDLLLDTNQGRQG